MKYILITCCCFLVFTNCKQNSPKDKIAEDIAQANGLKEFGNVKMIEFTFNVQRDTAKPSQRHWQWYPQTNEGVLITDSGSTKFSRTDTTTEEMRKMNARLTNDEYWLLYPLHLSWDKGYELRDSGMKTSPVHGKNMKTLSIQYNDKDGFTPGDTYDIYVDESNMIREWAYHKQSAAEQTLATTWEDYQDFNGLKIAREHKSKDGKFRIYFTDIKIEK